jgi:hypothetical protein
MLPKYHIFYGLIFSLILFILFPDFIGLTGFFIIFLSSFLIDVDHYLYYAISKKDFSLKNAYSWFIEKSSKANKLSKAEKKKLKTMPCIFHGIEAFFILAILSFFFPIFLFFLLGFAFHEALDAINIIRNDFSLNHIGSQIRNFLNYSID